jgi:hypothetical protein
MTTYSAHHLDDGRLEIWWSALGAGLVVIVCVVILLSLLSAFVRDIHRHLRVAAVQARGTAEHMSAGGLIIESARLINDLGDELELHLSVVARVGGDAP